MSLTRAYLRAWRYYQSDWAKIVLSITLVGLTTLANLAQPFPLAILVDYVLMHKAPDRLPHRLFATYGPKGALAQIVVIAAAVLALRLIGEAIGFAQGFLKIRIGYNGLLRVRCELFSHLQRLSLSFYRSRAQGDLIYRLNIDTQGFVAAYNVVQGILINVITLVFMTWIMFAMNWRLALVAVSIMPVLFIAIRKYGGVLTRTSIRANQIEADLATTVHRSVATMGLVQAFGREGDEYGRFRDGVGRSSSAWVKMHMQGMVYWSILGLCFGIGTALIVGYGGYLSWKGAMDAGILWVFFQYVTAQLYGPLQSLSGSETELRRGLAGMMRVYEVLDTDPEIKDAPDAVDLPRKSRVLELNHVSFAYSKEADPVLRDVSVRIEPGEMVAFVGSSGAGKTSLLNLLPRFYDPTGGAVRLDGTDMRKLKLKDLRKHIALVLQESPILSATVAENIAFGNPGASEAQIREAARMAGAEAFVESLPQKYRSPLHEGGQNISGGQRQRIGIARALATEAPILVLDEPTSALDSHNEQMVTETLRGLKGTRTVVIVSHRLSTVTDCDRIYVMEAGRIVEQGTHEGLIAARGTYFRLARHQMKLENVAPVTTA
ncbi:MAG TPA: ABC transporter ATP-binding protein [Tepidisphaeraceae bacterium]|nr:ABC transporter ATP-binding protein [Tepidisphaeraceae bacterium]